MTRIALVLAAMLCAACATEPRAQRFEAAPSPGEVWVESIAQAHARADVARDPDLARRALEAARDLPVPPDITADDRRRVLQDVAFRLSLVALDGGDPARAVSESERGLALGKAEDEFTANLYIVRARAETARGHAVEAARSYSEALALHERMLERALEGRP